DFRESLNKLSDHLMNKIALQIESHNVIATGEHEQCFIVGGKSQVSFSCIVYGDQGIVQAVHNQSWTFHFREAFSGIIHDVPHFSEGMVVSSEYTKLVIATAFGFFD